MRVRLDFTGRRSCDRLGRIIDFAGKSLAHPCNIHLKFRRPKSGCFPNLCSGFHRIAPKQYDVDTFMRQAASKRYRHEPLATSLRTESTNRTNQGCRSVARGRATTSLALTPKKRKQRSGPRLRPRCEFPGPTIRWRNLHVRSAFTE
jgi:hypothetical protein